MAGTVCDRQISPIWEVPLRFTTGIATRDYCRHRVLFVVLVAVGKTAKELSVKSRTLTPYGANALERDSVASEKMRAWRKDATT